MKPTGLTKLDYKLASNPTCIKSVGLWLCVFICCANVFFFGWGISNVRYEYKPFSLEMKSYQKIITTLSVYRLFGLLLLGKFLNVNIKECHFEKCISRQRNEQSRGSLERILVISSSFRTIENPSLYCEN